MVLFIGAVYLKITGIFVTAKKKESGQIVNWNSFLTIQGDPIATNFVIIFNENRDKDQNKFCYFARG